MQKKWTLRLVTAVLWALAAASAVYWVLRLSGPAPGASTPVASTLAGPGDNAARKAAIARLLGAQPLQTSGVVVAASSRFTLAGVVSQGMGGAALLVVDGKPARPYRVGSAIDDNTVLQSVGPRHAVLSSAADGSTVQRLELPALGAPRMGNMPTSVAPSSGLPTAIVVPALPQQPMVQVP